MQVAAARTTIEAYRLCSRLAKGAAAILTVEA